MNRRYLFFTVFMGGMSTLAIEFTTSRMLQTVYGTSNLVWANVIGLVLLFLALGSTLGGRLADKYPSPQTFYLMVCAAGASGIFFLLLASTILKRAAAGMAALQINVIIASLLGVALTLTIPILLLGGISTFAVRLGLRDLATAGQISGQISAISTIGSLVGTYASSLLVIPLAGSRPTAVIFGGALLLTGLMGLWQTNRRLATPTALASLLLILPITLWASGPIKTDPSQLYETESAYNYIQVIQRNNCNYLLLNEGQAYHSFYCPGDAVPNVSVWSIMLAAPFLNDTIKPPTKIGVIGLAAGTIPRQYLRAFGQIQVDGIELDPAIVQAGYDYFAMDDPRINVIVGDGRYQLNQLHGGYDVITIDAYKVPYIPWHLTTAEFFTEVKAQLTPTGIVAINVGRAPQDRRLVEAMTATLQPIFPTIHTIDVPNSLNTILFATAQPTNFDNIQRHLATLQTTDPLLPTVLNTAVQNHVPTIASNTIFYDHRAPVETIIDSLVIRYLLNTSLNNLPNISQ